jgi:hypothetical protein
MGDSVINPFSLAKSDQGPTGLEPVDKILVAVASLGMLGIVGMMGVAAIWKAPFKEITSNQAYKGAKKIVTVVKLAWDTAEPWLRKANPDYKEKYYWIDQLLDFLMAFLSLSDLGSVFMKDSGGY